MPIQPVPPVETPDTVDQAAEPQADLWTSDSERGLGTSEALPSGATDTETPEPDAAVSADPAPDAASTTRDEAGKFVKKGKPRNDPRARVEAATAKEAAAKEEARLAREEAARYKAELESARRPAAAPVATPEPVGDFPGFDAWSAENPGKDWDTYNRAAIRHEARREAQELLAHDRLQTQTQTRLSAYQSRLQTARQSDPELERLLSSTHTPVDDALTRRGLRAFPPIIHEAVVDSEHAPDILRYFGAHPEDAAQLAVKVKDLPASAVSVVRDLLESYVASAAVDRPDSARGVRPSAAKPPVNRVGGTANATPVDPDELEFGPEFIRLENQREQKRREGGRW